MLRSCTAPTVPAPNSRSPDPAHSRRTARPPACIQAPTAAHSSRASAPGHPQSALLAACACGFPGLEVMVTQSLQEIPTGLCPLATSGASTLSEEGRWGLLCQGPPPPVLPALGWGPSPPMCTSGSPCPILTQRYPPPSDPKDDTSSCCSPAQQIPTRIVLGHTCFPSPVEAPSTPRWLRPAPRDLTPQPDPQVLVAPPSSLSTCH